MLTAAILTAAPTSTPPLLSTLHLRNAQFSAAAAGTRRSVLSFAFAAAMHFNSPALAAEPWPYKNPPPGPLYETASKILFYDVPAPGSPFGSDILPTMKPEVVLDTGIRDPSPPGPVVNSEGTKVGLNYRVRSKSLRGEIVECSDCIGLGTVTFAVGDGSVNAAVDELVRTLPSGVTRRAIVPESFKLIREDQVMYGTRWPVPSYVELNLGIRAGVPTFRCAEVDGSCICDPIAAKGGTDMLPKRD